MGQSRRSGTRANRIEDRMKTKDKSRKWMWWFLGIIGAMQLYFVRELLAAFALFALGFAAIASVIAWLNCSPAMSEVSHQTDNPLSRR